MIRQEPGKTNRDYLARITFGRCVAFLHRGWGGRAFPDGMAKSCGGIDAATHYAFATSLSQSNPNHALILRTSADDSFHLLNALMMVQETDRIVVGRRFKMSVLGADRFPELADRTGIVVHVSHSTTGITVLFDGAKRPTVLHRDFISLV